ncbi:MAG: hypothetical protein U0165_05485 [Polyangiaceae bacterium]
MHEPTFVGRVSQVSSVDVHVKLEWGASAIQEGDTLYVPTGLSGSGQPTGVGLRAITSRDGTLFSLPIDDPVDISLGAPVFSLGPRDIHLYPGRIVDALGRHLRAGRSPTPTLSTHPRHHPWRVTGWGRWHKTGIKVIDVLAPLPEASRIGIIERRLLGALVVRTEIAMRFIQSGGDVIWCSLGISSERACALRNELNDTPELHGVHGFVSTLADPPGAVLECAWAAISAAEALAETGQRKVLLVLDGVETLDRLDESIHRPRGQTVETIRQRLWGQSNLHSLLYEYIVSVGEGVLGSTDHLEAALWFTDQRASAGLYPTVDISRSSSRVLASDFVSTEHRGVAKQLRDLDLAVQQAQRGFGDISQQLISRHRKASRYLTQPFYVAAPFTGMPGSHVSDERAVADLQTLLTQDVQISEQALYMIGNLDDARIKDSQWRK